MPTDNADINVWRGNNRSVIFEFASDEDTLFPLAGSQFLLTIAVRGQVVITKDTDDAADGFAMSEETSRVTWTPTLDESRLVPLGRIADYELERRIGDEQYTLVAGKVIGQGGLNND